MDLKVIQKLTDIKVKEVCRLLHLLHVLVIRDSVPVVYQNVTLDP